jgi:hypothetical protein
MRQLKLFGLALVALSASAFMLATSATAALPQILPESAAERTWTGKSIGKTELSVLGNAIAVVCNNATAEGTEEAKKPLGLFHIDFKECKAAGIVACTGLGEAKEVILALGKWHLVFDILSPLGTATLFLIEPLVHFECGAGKLFLVLGSVLCLDLEPGKKGVTHEFHCNTNGTQGDPEETQYFDANGNAQKAELLTSENEGAEVMSAQKGLGTVTYKEEVFADF